MNHKMRFFLIWFFFNAILVASILAIGVFIFQQISAEDRLHLTTTLSPYLYYILVPLASLLALIIFGTKWLLNSFWIVLGQIVEEMKLNLASNPSHRINLPGRGTLSQIADLFNQQANQMEELQIRVDEQITKAKMDLEREKNVLSLLIEALSEGIIVCNKEGIILLYNQMAKTLLNPPPNPEKVSAPPQEKTNFVGLERSLMTIIETPLLTYTINELKERQQMGSDNLEQHFIIEHGGSLINVEAIGIIDQTQQLGGFIFIFQDVSPKADIPRPYERQQQNLKEKMRSDLANVRASIEAILDYPHLPEQKRKKFLEIVRDNSIKLTSLLDQDPAQTVKDISSIWSLGETFVREWLNSLDSKLKSLLSCKFDLDLGEESCWINLNQYLMTQTLVYLLGQLQQAQTPNSLLCRLHQDGHFVMIDLVWDGAPLLPEHFRQWITQSIKWEEINNPVTISGILHQHDAEIWLQAGHESESHYIRLFFPKLEENKSKSSKQRSISLEHRPVFYDFDLFDKTPHPELDNASLSDLTYTVFDTETTGLNPSGGDEIISIAAIRIVNGRLLEGETFEQLIDPLRSIPQESINIHGIHPEMLEGKPLIEQALPHFHKFAENTVLVGHNAAFDMRFFQMKEKVVNVSFTHPVLDTLLLSAVVHPYQDQHFLEKIAERFNLKVEARHTALGDALLTAKIFLKLIPLLAQQNIHTLKDTLLASKETQYAKLKY
ncbi:MAG: hypothetical protein HQM14_09515 [SAR324 cluster bacterium]|nr:hypothetical protein [SAR324 cluster bacterium]